MKVVWTERAAQHLESIYEQYLLLTCSELQASSIYNEILNQSARLSDFPSLGVREILLEDSETKYRSLVVFHGNYKLIYFVEGDTVVISGVWNCRMNPKRLQDYIS